MRLREVDMYTHGVASGPAPSTVEPGHRLQQPRQAALSAKRTLATRGVDFN